MATIEDEKKKLQTTKIGGAARKTPSSMVADTMKESPTKNLFSGGIRSALIGRVMDRIGSKTTSPTIEAIDKYSREIGRPQTPFQKDIGNIASGLQRTIGRGMALPIAGGLHTIRSGGEYLLGDQYPRLKGMEEDIYAYLADQNKSAEPSGVVRPPVPQRPAPVAPTVTPTPPSATATPVAPVARGIAKPSQPAERPLLRGEDVEVIKGGVYTNRPEWHDTPGGVERGMAQEALRYALQTGDTEGVKRATESLKNIEEAYGIRQTAPAQARYYNAEAKKMSRDVVKVDTTKPEEVAKLVLQYSPKKTITSYDENDKEIKQEVADIETGFRVARIAGVPLSPQAEQLARNMSFNMENEVEIPVGARKGTYNGIRVYEFKDKLYRLDNGEEIKG